VNWSVQPMWVINPTFQQVDSRIQVDEWLAQKWKEEIAKDRYLKSDAELWNQLQIEKK